MQDKLHLHWRLSEPTQTPQDHAKLRRARELATALVGGDSTNIPLVHPIRWPGSLHRKGQPRVARIVALNAGAEIGLEDALERLEDAAGLLPVQSNAIRSLLEQLSALGWLDRIDPPRPSSPPHWQVNPAVHARFADRAGREAARRGEAQAAIRALLQGAA